MKKFFSGKTRIFLVAACLLVAAAVVMQLTGCGIGLGRAYAGETAIRFAVAADYDLDLVNEKVTGIASGAVVLAAEPAVVPAEETEAEAETEEAHDHDHDHDHSFVLTRKTDFEVRVDVMAEEDAAALAEEILAALIADIPTLKLVGVYTSEGADDICDLATDALKTLACVAGILLIYCWIRHNFAAALAAVLSCLLTFALTCAVVTLLGCCLKAEPWTVGGLLAAECASAVLSLALLAQISTMSRVAEFQRMGRAEQAAAAEKAAAKVLIVAALAAVLAMAALIFSGVAAVSGMMISVVIGVISAAVTYWAFTGKAWVALSDSMQARKARKLAKNA